MYYVYILQSFKSGILYYGYTTNLKRRFYEHNNGNSKFTKGHLPWKLVFYSAFDNELKAKDFEIYLKSGSGKAFVYKRLVSVSKNRLVSEAARRQRLRTA